MTLPSTMKAVTGTLGSAVALAATATTPEQVVACALAGLTDLGTWLVPNHASHPRWYRRAAKACVSAAGVGLAAVPLALAGYEGAGPSASVGGVWLQLDSADWTTLGVLAARTALVALLANGPTEHTPAAAVITESDEVEAVDLDPRVLSDEPLPAAPAGVTLTGVMAAVPPVPARTVQPAAGLRDRPDKYARRAARVLADREQPQTQHSQGRHS